MVCQGGQDPPAERPSDDQHAAPGDRSVNGSASGGVSAPAKNALSWWENALHRLGDDILAEAVPDRLRSACSTGAVPKAEARSSRDDPHDE